MLFGPRKPFRFAVFLSGSGSTLQSIIEIQGVNSPVLIISNNQNAIGILRAKRFGIPVYTYSGAFKTEDVVIILKKYKIDFIFLAGFMKVLKSEFIEKDWCNKIFNIHPSLLPEYKGLNAAERSWKDNSSMGVSIHEVVTELDSGKILSQSKSSNCGEIFNQNEAMMFLRSAEQNLLRNFFLKAM